MNEKSLYLKIQLDKATPNITLGANEIKVNRENLIHDSIQIFKQMNDPRKVLKVTFEDEVSQDVGGISREFFFAIMKEMLNENYGLFGSATTDQFSYKINEDSNEIGGWEELFYFFGRLIAKAFFDRVPLNLCLNRSIFNALLNKNQPSDYADLKFYQLIDRDIKNSLTFFLENDLDAYRDDIQQYFVATVTQQVEKELKPNGKQIRVTNKNKKEFVNLKAHFVAYVAV